MADNTPSDSQRYAETEIKSRSRGRIISILVGMILFWPILAAIIYGYHWAYNKLDQSTFPKVSPALSQAFTDAGSKPSEAQRAMVMSAALRGQLERELHSTFGWSANDLIISPTRWLDNRANRQRGVISATRMMVTFFSPNIAKLGPGDMENPKMKELRERHLAYSEEVWGFMRSSSEKEYRRAVELLKEYAADVQAGKAVFNLRTDDMYNMLNYMMGETLMGEIMGLLTDSNEQVRFFENDDRLYYAQGVVLVIRDMFTALITMYPEISEKGGKQNTAAALTAMDSICTFYPVIVLNGHHDSLMADHRGKMARYLITMQNRMNDIAQAIRR